MMPDQHHGGTVERVATCPTRILAIDLAKRSFQVCATVPGGACVDAPSLQGDFSDFFGPVINFICGWAVEHYAAMVLMNRLAKMTANWAFAMFHSSGGIFHSFSDRFKIR